MSPPDAPSRIAFLISSISAGRFERPAGKAGDITIPHDGPFLGGFPAGSSPRPAANRSLSRTFLRPRRTPPGIPTIGGTNRVLSGGHHMPGSVVVGGARTPIGKLSGSLAGLSGADLGGIAIKD